jgi:hypothetical protein
VFGGKSAHLLYHHSILPPLSTAKKGVPDAYTAKIAILFTPI